jgi:hypothetical protein
MYNIFVFCQIYMLYTLYMHLVIYQIYIYRHTYIYIYLFVKICRDPQASWWVLKGQNENSFPEF